MTLEDMINFVRATVASLTAVYDHDVFGRCCRLREDERGRRVRPAAVERVDARDPRAHCSPQPGAA